MTERSKLNLRNLVVSILLLAFLVESGWITTRLKLTASSFLSFDADLVFFVIRQFEHALKCSIAYNTTPSLMIAWPIVTFLYFALSLLLLRSTFLKQVNSFVMANFTTIP